MILLKKAILPQGFRASGLAAGIKKSGSPDLALLASIVPAKASARFTSNKVWAAPLKVCQEHLRNNKEYRAVIINSGNANCFTGQAGVEDAYLSTRLLAKAMDIQAESVLVASTGIIGRKLPVAKIKKSIPSLVASLSEDGIDDAKMAIMTTDNFAKEITAKVKIAGCTVTICGIAKGAGMIAPNMVSPSGASAVKALHQKGGKRLPSATMLCFIMTDAAITQGALDKALDMAVGDSFNSITIDGCMSTNDSVIVLANGLAGNVLIDKDKYFAEFFKGLDSVCLELAKLIIRDAEGATKFICIRVNQAKTNLEAKTAALSIANSNLFKTAIYGENPNFGRIIAALGASGVDVREDDIRIKVSSLRKKDINVDVYLKRGSAVATVYTCDLTSEYVKINAEYN